tara:strand:- start:331 stop:468 length:138 start_codon:yes stop_codon:yes gene_type:complete
VRARLRVRLRVRLRGRGSAEALLGTRTVGGAARVDVLARRVAADE